MKTKLFGIVMTAAMLAGCYTTVEPGRVGIKVKQTGGDRGVQDIPAESGRVFYNPLNEYVLEYPTSVQRAIWTINPGEGKGANEEIAFQSSDSLHFTADVAVAYHLPLNTVPHFYVQFRNDDLAAFTHGFFRDATRSAIGDAAHNLTAEEINGGKQADLASNAQKHLAEKMLKYGVVIDQLVFTSPPRPPAQVKTAIEAKIAATQSAERVENQLREAAAEAKKTIVTAQAEAEANRLRQTALTPAILEQMRLAKWNGVLPQVVGTANPFVSLGGK